MSTHIWTHLLSQCSRPTHTALVFHSKTWGIFGHLENILCTRTNDHECFISPQPQPSQPTPTPTATPALSGVLHVPELSGEVAEAIGGGVKTLGAAYGGLSRALTICDPCTPLGSLPERVLHTCPLQMSGERKKKNTLQAYPSNLAGC